jgi:hypothetical protein
VARPTLSGNMNFFFYKFPLFCDNMDNFVHNAANKTSEFLQYVVVPKSVALHRPLPSFFLHHSTIICAYNMLVVGLGIAWCR